MSTATEDEVITPDAVHSAPGTAVEVAQPDPGRAAVEAAAEAALAMPGVPGRDEFLALAMQARMLAMSGAAPEAVRNDPYVAFHVAMVGRDLGISPSAALQLIDVIKTKNGYQLSLSPQLLNGQIRRLGLGRIVPVLQERDRCIARALGPDGEILGETEFTWEDARDAGLVGLKCMPGEHATNRDGRCGCNQGYRTYPRRMMWWRASGFCAADLFPEAGLGLYSPEELGSVVDDQGRPLDPATVALPPGYDDPAEQRRQQQAAADQPAAGDKLWELQELIYALPAQLLAELRQQWRGEQSRVKDFAPHELPQRLLAIGKGMATARWATARREGVDQKTALAALRAQLAAIVGALRWGWLDEVPDLAASGAPEAQETLDEAPAPEIPAHEEEPSEAPEGEIDWTPMLRDTAETVRAVLADVPPEVRTRITEAVEHLHHTKVNAEIAGCGDPEVVESFPPSSPIGLRRMAVTLLRVGHFQEHGEVLDGT